MSNTLSRKRVFFCKLSKLVGDESSQALLDCYFALDQIEFLQTAKARGVAMIFTVGLWCLIAVLREINLIYFKLPGSIGTRALSFVLITAIIFMASFIAFRLLYANPHSRQLSRQAEKIIKENSGVAAQIIELDPVIFERVSKYFSLH